MIRCLWVSLLFIAIMVARPLWATEIDDKEFREIAGELRCPTCTGLSVLDSEARFSVQIKDEVRHQITQGQSKSQILKFFTDRYGPWILRKPPNDGINALVWWLPICLLVLGPIAIWFLVVQRKMPASGTGLRSTEAILDEMKAAIEAETRRLTGGAP